jgi:release factor glutamine methyltransferase
MNTMQTAVNKPAPPQPDAARLGAQYTNRLHHLEQSLSTLPDKPEETPDSCLRALWHLAGGEALSVAAAEEQTLPGLNAAQLATLDACIAQRLQGTPVAYLTGRQRFMGLDLLAAPEALIPRRETEMLGVAALAKLREAVVANGAARVIDVCCGSGNLALALAAAEPCATVHAADLSPEAIALAGQNVVQQGLSARVVLHTGDLLAPFDTPEFHDRIDLIVSAPPYISTAKLDTMPAEIIAHEPTLAFDGGPFGVSILMRLMRESPALLRAGGWLGIEVGLGQGPAMQQMLRKNTRYDTVETVCDAAGQVRVLLARKAV